MTDSQASSTSLSVPTGNEREGGGRGGTEVEFKDTASLQQQSGNGNWNGDGKPVPTPSVTHWSGINSHNHSLNASRSTSTTASPQASRDSSPAGRAFRQQAVGTTATGMRARKDSHDASPHRPPSVTGYTVPSAAAIQRALSAAVPHPLQSTTVSESSSKLPRASRTAPGVSGDISSSWSAPPRLKSPPPPASRRESLRSPRKTELPPIAPSILVRPSSTDRMAPTPEAQGEFDSQIPHLAKAAGRGASGAPTLETVQETSLPVTPTDAPNSDQSPGPQYFDVKVDEDHVLASGNSTPKTLQAQAGDSGSDRDRHRKETGVDPEKTPKAEIVGAKASFSSLRAKSGFEPKTRNMTVETETITSIPQSALGAASDRVASGRTEHGGTIRVKPSTETIRPGKARRKATRKAPSINATAASTRADIFEDRVKNAMDEATSDDSDETFVYESNPHEPQIRRSRQHSRTPSVNSLASQGEQRVSARAAQNALATQKTRSMKFTNPHSSGPDDDALERQDGTIRASSNRNGGSSIHHHHLGRPNRHNTGHASILDDDNSPFPELNKTRMQGRQSHNARYVARNLQVANGTNRKIDPFSSYDMDAEGGDDERTPLMGTVRTPRSTRRLLQPPRTRFPSQYPQHQQSMLSRCAGAFVLVVMLLLLAFGIVGFLFAMSTPLSGVMILDVQKVLASEQELMFDLVVGAVNPNFLSINVGHMDLNVFAKSKYVGSEKWWREHGNAILPSATKSSPRKSRTQRRRDYRRDSLVVYEDALDDSSPKVPKPTSQTMLLGHIEHFDSPLTFEGSMWTRDPRISTGSLRLSRPGNRTELGGTERWEGVLLHPFELIVRGTLKYKIPIVGRAYSANVGATTIVHPETGIGTPDDNNVDQDGGIKISS